MKSLKHRGQGSEAIRAHVVLKGSAGGLSSGAPVSSGNVRAYVADPSVRERVRATLERLGFSIRRVSGLAITVEAPPARFEIVFGGQLKKVGRVRQASSKSRVAKSPASSGESFWTWSRSPVIPPEMRDVIDTVVLPQPTRILR